ncbi:MAG: tetratricopeptide repeat protein [Tannerella sp.]|nr:tetratricopeptide repeat protein [Tannerella sp.]
MKRCLQSWVKPRNSNFTGREEILERIGLSFKNERGEPTALIGTDGLGKTETALEYACRHADEYTLVWWVDAACEASIMESYRQFAQMSGAEIPATAEACIRAVRDWTRTQEGWLFIFDDLRDKDIFERYAPSVGKGDLLLTSSVEDTWGKDIRLLPLKEEEAVRLLSAESGLPPQEMEELARALGTCPLVLGQAAAYLAIHQDSPRDYLENFRLSESRIPEDWGLNPGERRHYACLSLALNGMRDEGARQLFSFLGCFAPTPIQGCWLKYACDAGLPLPLQETLSDERQYELAVMELERCRLIHRTNDKRLLLNRLTQECLVKSGAADLWPAACTHLLNRFVDYDFTAPEAVDRFLERAPHILVMAERLADEGRLQAAAQGDYFLGFGFKAAGNYRQALKGYGKALSLDKKRDDAALDMAATYNELGVTLSSLGLQRQALKQYRAALAIYEASPGISGQMAAATVCNSMAEAYKELDELERLPEFQRKALSIRAAILGENHPQTAASHNMLATAYYLLERYEEAVKEYLLAYKALRLLQGESYPDTVAVRENLAVAYEAAGYPLPFETWLSLKTP